MEMCNDSLHPRWPPLGDEPVDEYPEGCAFGNPDDNYEPTILIPGDPVRDAGATPEIPIVHSNLHDQVLEFLQEQFIYSFTMGVLDLEPFAMTEIASLRSSGYAVSTPPSGELGSISTPATLEQGLSPDTYMGQTPLSWCDTLHSPIIDAMPEPFAVQQNTSADIGDAVVVEAPITPPGVNFQDPSSQMFNTPRQLTMKDRPSEVSSRKWRNKIKPEKCPGCWMRFPYLGDRDKHIAAKHPELADEHDVPIKRHSCKKCDSTFARKDHLARHETNKHGRLPKKKRHRK